MSNGRSQRRRVQHAPSARFPIPAQRDAPAEPLSMSSKVDGKATEERPTARRACERCGGGCRKTKPPYGWVCGKCAHELDAYVIIRMA